MTDALLVSELPPDAAVLVVLLPASTPGVSRAGQAVSPAMLAGLQQQLGAAIRVLRIDEASHASVVSSFHAASLPCFVLVRHGIELWRECGAPDATLLAEVLLSKLGTIGVV